MYVFVLTTGDNRGSVWELFCEQTKNRLRATIPFTCLYKNILCKEDWERKYEKTRGNGQTRSGVDKTLLNSGAEWKNPTHSSFHHIIYVYVYHTTWEKFIGKYIHIEFIGKKVC